MMVGAWRMVWPLLGAMPLAGCAPLSGFVYDETLAGPYRLVAVDTMDQMGICRSVPGGAGDCVGDGLPSDTVIAAGANERYLVAARRPAREPFGEAPKSPAVAEYYYIIRTPDEAERGPPAGNIVGPLTEQQFARAKRGLALPDFSRVFAELH